MFRPCLSASRHACQRNSVRAFKASQDALYVGGAAANALGLFADGSDKLVLRPGGMLLVTAPDADGIEVGSNDKLKLEHSGDTTSSLEYEIVILGASA